MRKNAEPDHRVAEPVTGTPMMTLENLERLPSHGRVEHTGYIQSVTHGPAGEQPRLLATVVDGFSAPGVRRATIPHVRLLFMGQRQVPGIKPGVRIRYSGMLSQVDRIPTIHNPRYLILPAATEP